MLDDVAEQPHVVRPGAELLCQVHLVEVAHDDPVAELPGPLGRLGIELYSGDLAAAFLEDPGDGAGRAPEIDNALVLADEEDLLGVGAVVIREVDLLIVKPAHQSRSPLGHRAITV